MAQPLPWLKPGLLVGGTIPGAVIAFWAATGTLAANPIEAMLNKFGLLALVFLIASLVCTPLKSLLGWTWPIRVRRMLGVFSFVYAALHVSTYVGLDQAFDFAAIGEDIVKRKFILVGFLAFVLLIPLAATSTNAMVKRLGFKRWQRLHRLVYPAALLACTHFILRVKKDLTEPGIYVTILVTLLLIRIAYALKKRMDAAPNARPKGTA